MKTLETQLAEYCEYQSELHGPVSADEITTEAGVVVLDLLDRASDDAEIADAERRSWVPYVLATAAAIVLMLAGLSLLYSGDEGSTDVISDGEIDRETPEPSVPEPDPPDLVPPILEDINGELTWTISDYSTRTYAVLVSDGDQFFIIDSGVASSADGFSWESQEIQNMPAAEVLTGEFSISEAAAGRILHLVVRDGEATTYLFDLAAGEVHESVLPLRTEEATGLSGFVSINDEGEAVALLSDDGERNEQFYSSNGIDWIPIPEGQLPSDVALDTVALGDGFVAAARPVRRDPTNIFWHSPDGSAWQALEAEGIVTELLSWRGNAIGYSETDSPEAYGLTQSNGKSLDDVDVSTLGHRCAGDFTVAAGDIGLAAHCPSLPWVDFSSDGVTWVRQDLPFPGRPEALRTDEPGVVVLVPGRDRVLIKVDDEIWIGTPNEPAPAATAQVSLTWSDIGPSIEPVEVVSDGRSFFALVDGVDGSGSELWVSDDGTTWLPVTDVPFSGIDAVRDGKVLSMEHNALPYSGRVLSFTIHVVDRNGTITEHSTSLTIPESDTTPNFLGAAANFVGDDGLIITGHYEDWPVVGGVSPVPIGFRISTDDGVAWDHSDQKRGQISDVTSVEGGLFATRVRQDDDLSISGDFVTSADGREWTEVVDLATGQPIPGNGRRLVPASDHVLYLPIKRGGAEAWVITTEGATQLVTEGTEFEKIDPNSVENSEGWSMTIGDGGVAYFTGFTSGVPQEPARPTAIVVSTDYETWTRFSLPDEMIGPEGEYISYRMSMGAAGVVAWGNDTAWFGELNTS